jgi:lipopolysaccharide export system protein LptC
MTLQADIIRDERRAFAAPGGFHDRLIAFLAKALPAAIGVVAAVMILAPLSQRGEISFLLDRNEVAITDKRIEVDGAMYRGQDSAGRPFQLIAGKAVQRSSDVPVVVMENLLARMQMAEGPAELRAPKGTYNFDVERVDIAGPVSFQAADGYRMVTNNVAVDLKTRKAVGSGGVEGAVPTGSFSADRITADLSAHTVSLDGHARLLMTPGKLRIPQ